MVALRKRYIYGPIGFVSKDQEDKVCYLKRFIYSLKQSFTSRHFRVHKAITLFSLSMVLEDPCVDDKRPIKGIIFLTVYVTDMLLAGNNLDMIEVTNK